MALPRFSRRRLLAAGVALFPAARLAHLTAAPATDPLAGLSVLPPGRWRTIAALVDEVWPHTDAMPSAVEAGVLRYLSARLAGSLPGYRRAAKPGADVHLTAWYGRIASRADELASAHGKAFADLPAAQRSELVAKLAAGSQADVGYNVKGTPSPDTARDPELFALLRRHVLEGLFCDPAHGGNVKHAAWEAIGHTCHSNYPRAHRCDPSRKFHN